MFLLVQPFDDWVLQTLAASRTEVLTTLMTVVSFLGEWYILLPATAIIVFLLWRRRLILPATQFAYAVVGTFVAAVVLKLVVARSRPPEALRLIAEGGYSFPSMHAAIAIAFWGYLAYLAARRIQNPIGRIAVVISCVFLILITDISRLYLGVHYFSDVVGSTLLAGLVLLISL